MFADAVLFCERGQFVEYFVGQVLHGELVRAKDQQASDVAACGDSEVSAIAGVGEEDIVAERAFVGDDVLSVAYQQFLLYFHHVERNDEAGGSGFAMEFQITVELEVHDCIGKMRIDIVRMNGSRAPLCRDREQPIVDGGIQPACETSQPLFEDLQLE